MADTAELTAHDYNLLAQGLARWAGLRLDDRQRSTVYTAVRRRMQLTAAPTLRDYLSQLTPRSAEWQALYEELAVHETAFFRHSGQFAALQNQILPELVDRRDRDRVLRLWSAATSTGEEAYSLAIAVSELNLGKSWKIEILGTDLSGHALARARQGVYPARRLRNLPAQLRDRYLLPVDEDRWQVRPELQRMVKFSMLNLAQPPHAPTPLVGHRDVVFFANTIIYMTDTAVQTAVDFIRGVLQPDSYLFLGYAETLWGYDEGFQLVAYGNAYAYQLAGPTPPAGSAAVDTVGTPAVAPVLRASTGPLVPGLPRPLQRRATGPLNPTEARYMARVTAQIEINDLDAAEGMLRDWLAAEPGAPRALFTLARVKAAQGDTQTAVVLLRQVIAIDTLHVTSYVLMAAMFIKLNEQDEALGHLRRALFIDPHQPLAYYYQGQVYQARGDVERARLAYRNALRAMDRFKPSWDTTFTNAQLTKECERAYRQLTTGGLTDDTPPTGYTQSEDA